MVRPCKTSLRSSKKRGRNRQQVEIELTGKWLKGTLMSVLYVVPCEADGRREGGVCLSTVEFGALWAVWSLDGRR